MDCGPGSFARSRNLHPRLTAARRSGACKYSRERVLMPVRQEAGAERAELDRRMGASETPRSAQSLMGCRTDFRSPDRRNQQFRRDSLRGGSWHESRPYRPSQFYCRMPGRTLHRPMYELPSSVRRRLRSHSGDTRCSLISQMILQLRGAGIPLGDPFHPLAIWCRSEIDQLRSEIDSEATTPKLIWEVRRD